MGDQTVQSKGLIKSIDKTSVHKLCSGQVVLTLATAVKELVENSLDAGSTNITVRFVKSGLESLEVSDNGSGVDEDNFEALTLKHFTSKISEFDDLVNIGTYGFRGEALSSMCALSKVTVLTRSGSAEVGTKLCFDNGGKIVSKSICPRQQGTTVVVEDLFSTLPVRRKELEKNISREFGRMVNYISGYCLIRIGLKLTITNLVKNNGSTATVLRVSGNSSTKGNIMDVFGMKQWTSLVEFVACSQPDEEVIEELGISMSQDKISSFLRDLTVTGYISSAEHGQGRSSSDRQFFFINQRPFDSQKLSRLINEVYHSFNRNQYPFVVLDVRIARSSVDVNVTPDKRQVFLQNEKILLAVIKSSLKRMYAMTPSVCKSISASTDKGSSKTSTPQASQNLNSPQKTQSTSKKRNFTEAFELPSTSSPTLSSSFIISSMKKQKTLDTFCLTNSSSHYSNGTITHNCGDDVIIIDKADDALITNHKENNDSNNNVNINNSITDDIVRYDIQKFDTNINIRNCHCDETVSSCKDHNLPKMSSSLDDPSAKDPSSKNISSSFSANKPQFSTTTNSSSVMRYSFPSGKMSNTNEKNVRKERPFQSKKNSNNDSKSDDDDDLDRSFLEQRRSKIIHFSLSKLKEKLQNKEFRRNSSHSPKEAERRFKAQIQPSDNGKAESELQRMISKDMFEKMEILGQFNLGFIITKLNSDLFIVDQHASDEKFNFERLQKTVVLQNQQLIRPMKMELTASNESVLVENLDIFLKNGFKFQIDLEANMMERVMLTSIPTSRNWAFGHQDVEEMIFMLTESPGVMCRPSRIRQMLASRACRSSVMIGTALSASEMKKLIIHMGEINQPWNCPHGRPTIRHLVNLNMLEI